MKQWTSGLKAIKINVCTPDSHSRAGLLASATVEAAIVMPLFIYAITAIIYMLQIIMVKQDMNVAAYNTVRTMTKYAYAYDKLVESDKEVSAITAYGTLLSELGVNYAKEHYIVGGNAGIVLFGTNVLGETGEISITVSYAVKNPFDIFGIGVVLVNQTYSGQGWTGDEGVAQSIKDADKERTVYITPYGKVYHTDEECAYINLSITQIAAYEIDSARNMGGGRFYACELCMDGDETKNPTGYLFVTHFGDRYHKTPECSGLRRTIIEVPFSEIEDRDMCQKCRGV